MTPRESVAPAQVQMTPRTKTAGLSPRRLSPQWNGNLTPRATRGAAVLLDREVRLFGVALLGRVVPIAISDGAGGDVIVAAALKAARRSHGRDTSRSSVALSKGRAKPSR